MHVFIHVWSHFGFTSHSSAFIHALIPTQNNEHTSENSDKFIYKHSSSIKNDPESFKKHCVIYYLHSLHRPDPLYFHSCSLTVTVEQFSSKLFGAA